MFHSIPYIDYDVQATYVEAVLRVLDHGEKEDYNNKWFSEEAVKAAFLAIQNHDFENVRMRMYDLN